MHKISTRKKISLFALLVFSIAVAVYVWWVHFNYRFEEVSENKVYKSARIPPEKIGEFITQHHIKTVIDLRHPGVQDKLNPDNKTNIDLEKEAIAKLDNVRHINIPSTQVPTRETLSEFFKVLDDEDAYPVLMHCYHGTGRAQIYSALYRIEYENASNEEARAETRAILRGSSFDQGQPKGDFLINYSPRKNGAESTLNTLPK